MGELKHGEEVISRALPEVVFVGSFEYEMAQNQIQIRDVTADEREQTERQALRLCLDKPCVRYIRTKESTTTLL